MKARCLRLRNVESTSCPSRQSHGSLIPVLPRHSLGDRCHIELNLPDGGEIAFEASGYTQRPCAELVLLDEQRLPAHGQPPLLLNRELDSGSLR
jgi:hypothetical protein